MQAHLQRSVVRSEGRCSTRWPLPSFSQSHTCGRVGVTDHQLRCQQVQLGAALVQLGAARCSGAKVVEEAPPRQHENLLIQAFTVTAQCGDPTLRDAQNKPTDQNRGPAGTRVPVRDRSTACPILVGTFAIPPLGTCSCYARLLSLGALSDRPAWLSPLVKRKS